MCGHPMAAEPAPALVLATAGDAHLGGLDAHSPGFEGAEKRLELDFYAPEGSSGACGPSVVQPELRRGAAVRSRRAPAAADAGR